VRRIVLTLFAPMLYVVSIAYGLFRFTTYRDLDTKLWAFAFVASLVAIVSEYFTKPGSRFIVYLNLIWAIFCLMTLMAIDFPGGP
jgi:hypothetical protein